MKLTSPSNKNRKDKNFKREIWFILKKLGYSWANIDSSSDHYMYDYIIINTNIS